MAWILVGAWFLARTVAVFFWGRSAGVDLDIPSFVIIGAFGLVWFVVEWRRNLRRLDNSDSD